MFSGQLGDESAQWHDLLSRVVRAEHSCDVLLDAIRNVHEEHHSGAFRWCLVESCSVAEELRRRRRA
ncbi:hypothetical protein DFJ66_2578 [Saccharothrix variisporea]|uniref:Uncharacterized protein n=1 Tax=Saccharothrix variisporea TaxID=543527 RepID=A0A495X733_9PSEU|nr:hypothetical protein DFJ66_2578 [Saccharothrix variisporea]